jgi:DNA-binding CsgD family transcriptional regulator
MENYRDDLELSKNLKVNGSKTSGRPRFSYKTYPLLNTQALYVVSMRDGEMLYHRNIDNLLGYKKSEFDYKKALSIIHPDDYKLAQPIFQGTIDYSEKFGVPEDNCFYISFRMQKKDGTYLSVQQVSGVCKLHQDKTLNCYYSILQDISYLNSIIGVKWYWDNKELNEEEYRKMIGRSAHHTFTKREVQVFELLKMGMKSEDIANELGLTVHTVNTHRKNMLKKTGAKSSLEMIQLFD